MPSRTNKIRKNPTSEGKRAVLESLKSPKSVESIFLSTGLKVLNFFEKIQNIYYKK
ncbi:MAG: hypothetical protein CM15mP91_0360 [Chloroflexota bacterium]|nr:MAG: hypothetical protein CM15mP91_0360 [Chloroflexota bacterium]